MLPVHALFAWMKDIDTQQDKCMDCEHPKVLLMSLIPLPLSTSGLCSSFWGSGQNSDSHKGVSQKES